MGKGDIRVIDVGKCMYIFHTINLSSLLTQLNVDIKVMLLIIISQLLFSPCPPSPPTSIEPPWRATDRCTESRLLHLFRPTRRLQWHRHDPNDHRPLRLGRAWASGQIPRYYDAKSRPPLCAFASCHRWVVDNTWQDAIDRHPLSSQFISLESLLMTPIFFVPLRAGFFCHVT